MSTPVEINPLEMGGSGYKISRSVRLRYSASAYFSRTPAAASNQQKWTWSSWVKRGLVDASSNCQLFDAGYISTGVSANWFHIDLANNSINVVYYNGVSNVVQLVTTAVLRDPSAWYHLVVALDTTQATASNRLSVYVNGVQVTSFSTATYPALNATYPVNSTYQHRIGARPSDGFGSYQYYDGYLAEINFIDGQQLTSSSFGYTDSNGIWQPKAYTGTYGTNGFYLKFTDNSAATATTLGKDYSGNGNNWTPNNISVTAGTTYDSMVDSPTVGPAASNYATWNPLSSNLFSAATDGNLKCDIPNTRSCLGNVSMPSGKWYCEVSMSQTPCIIGIAAATTSYTNAGSNAVFDTAAAWGYVSNATKQTGGVQTAYGATYTTTDIIGIAYDASAGSLTFYKNGVSQGVAYTGITVPVVFAAYGGAGTTAGTYAYLNCGQRPFSSTPPSGYVALNTYNLPAATINNGATVMNAALYTGNGGSNSYTSLNFKTDFLWSKSRTNTAYHYQIDSVRGTSLYLNSNATSAEGTTATTVTFNSNGISYNGTESGLNANGQNYVNWVWNAGSGTTSSNTNGSITSTVSVNQSAGFSIATLTNAPSGTSFTVGHGLGVAPAMFIIKERNAVSTWTVYHKSLGATQRLVLNLTDAASTSAAYFNNTAPTSTVLTLGSNYIDGNTSVIYSWSEVTGYSKFGSYTGNGSTDGPFVYCGFQPRWVMIKRTDAGPSNWTIQDTSRDTYNVSQTVLYPNVSNAETTANQMDILSNGFKLRTSGTENNGSGATYIYAAFASNPFNISRAR